MISKSKFSLDECMSVYVKEIILNVHAMKKVITII